MARRSAARRPDSAGAASADLGGGRGLHAGRGAAPAVASGSAPARCAPGTHPLVGARALRGRDGGGPASVVRLPRRARPFGCVPLHPGCNQVPRDAHRARRHAARVSRLLPDDDALLLQSVDVRGARGASRGGARRRNARRAVDVGRQQARLRGADRHSTQRGDDAAGPADRNPPVRPVSPSCAAAMGIAHRLLGEERTLRLDDAGRDQRAFAFGHRRLPRRVRGDGSPESRALLARTRVLAIRRAQVDALLVRRGRRWNARDRTVDRLHRHDGTQQPPLALCARSSELASEVPRQRAGSVRTRGTRHARPADSPQQAGNGADAIRAALGPARVLSRDFGARGRVEPRARARKHAHDRLRAGAPRSASRSTRLHRRHILEVPRRGIRLYARAAVLRVESDRHVHVRRQARVLRALRERVRHHAARGRAFRRASSRGTRAARSTRAAGT